MFGWYEVCGASPCLPDAEQVINDVISRLLVTCWRSALAAGDCEMALLDWRSKRERDSSGPDTDGHIRRKWMLISCLLMIMMLPRSSGNSSSSSLLSCKRIHSTAEQNDGLVTLAMLCIDYAGGGST